MSVIVTKGHTITVAIYTAPENKIFVSYRLPLDYKQPNAHIPVNILNILHLIENNPDQSQT